MEAELSAARRRSVATQDQPKRQRPPPPATVVASPPGMPSKDEERAVLGHWVTPASARSGRSAIIRMHDDRLHVNLHGQSYLLTPVAGGWAVIGGRDNEQLYRLEMTEFDQGIVWKKLGSKGWAIKFQKSEPGGSEADEHEGKALG